MPALNAYAEPTPIVVPTGFLGSGKTTLVNRLLEYPALGGTAVLIDEFGEVGIDHQMVEVVDESTVLLASGCLCCTFRDDLKQAIQELQAKRARGVVPPYRRMIVETAGLADPAPAASAGCARSPRGARGSDRLPDLFSTVCGCVRPRGPVPGGEQYQAMAATGSRSGSP